MSKNEQSHGVSPYTGVRFFYIRIQVPIIDKQDKFEEHFRTELNPDSEGNPQFAEILSTPDLNPGDPVKY